MATLENYRGFLYFEAILFILLGCIGIAIPQVFTIGVEILIGLLLVAAGIIQAIRLFKHREAPGFWSTLLSSILSLALGVLLLIFPLAGIVSLTYLLIAYFFIEGASKTYYAFQVKPLKNWGWILASGLLAFLLAILILTGLPGTATWILGLLVAINMLFFGIVLLGFTMNLNRIY